MKYFILLCTLLINVPLIACSCNSTYFCKVMNESPESIAIQGTIVEEIDHGSGYISKVVKVIEVYKDNPGLRDTIDFVGGPNSASCETYMDGEIGDTLFITVFQIDSFKYHLNLPIIKDHYTRHHFNQCGNFSLVVDKETNSVVFANYVNGEYQSERYTKEELELFLRNGCPITSSTEQTLNSKVSILKSNMCYQGQIQFNENLDLYRIDRLNLYSLNGDKLFSGQLNDHHLFIKESLSNIIIVELFINGRAFIEKLIVVD